MLCCKKRQNRSFGYNMAHTEPKLGESSIFRNKRSLDKPLFVNPKGVTNMQEFWDQKFANNKEEWFIGCRRYTKTPQDMRKENQSKVGLEEKTDLNVKDLGQSPLNDFFSFYTYAAVEKKIKRLGSGIINLGLAPELNEFEDFKIKFVGIYSKNSTEWLLTDIACSYYGLTVVPIYDTQGEEATKEMFDQTNLTTLFLTCTHLNGILDSFKKGNVAKLKNQVIMDPMQLEFYPAKYYDTIVKLKTLEKDNKLKVYYFNDILEAGDNLVEAPKISPETIFTLSYTSGTTGKPKGAMISHKNAIACLTNEGNVLRSDSLGEKFVGLCYLPLAHVMSRFEVYKCAALDGMTGVYSGDILKIKEDCAILKPNGFNSVPRFYNKIHDAIKGQFAKVQGFKKTLINWGIEAKLANLERDGTLTHWFYDALIFNQIKDILGGNVKLMAVGSAPISNDILKFQKICFGVSIVEGYGQTEALGFQFGLEFDDTKTCGYVGGIFDHLEFKLIDVPEMNYFATNKTEDGRPNPQGEILIRGSSVFAGYYKNKAQFEETVDKDGWLHSGDIGEIGLGGALRIIDRAKNIFKLSQGEYIAPDRLGEIYKSSKSVAEIFVTGNSLKSTIVAMICPDESGLRELAKNNGVNEDSDFETLCKTEKIKALVIAELKQVAITNQLKGFENIRGVYLTPKDFGALGLLTEAMKVKRIQARDYFKPQIDELYKKLE